MWNDGIGLLFWILGGLLMITGMFLPSVVHTDWMGWGALGSGVVIMICAPWVADLRSASADGHHGGKK
jgi:ABC-type antimicrobial peptide transport system permease subunit